MRLPFPFHVLQRQSRSQKDASRAEEEYRFLVGVLWFIEAVVNHNYILSPEPVSPTEVTFSLGCNFPKGRASLEPDIEHKDFRGLLATTPHGYTCRYANVMNAREAFVLEVVGIKRKRPLFYASYTDYGGNTHTCRASLDRRPGVMVQPFIRLLKELGAAV